MKLRSARTRRRPGYMPQTLPIKCPASLLSVRQSSRRLAAAVGLVEKASRDRDYWSKSIPPSKLAVPLIATRGSGGRLIGLNSLLTQLGYHN